MEQCLDAELGLCACVLVQPVWSLGTQILAWVTFAPLVLCLLCSPQLRARRASDPSKCPRDRRRWGSFWVSVQVALPSSFSSWGPSLSLSVKGEWDQCPDLLGAPTPGKPAGHRGAMAGVGRAARLVTKYVEGCQPGHWDCGLAHWAVGVRDSAKGIVVAGAQVWLVPGTTLQECIFCLVPRSCVGSRHCCPLPRGAVPMGRDRDSLTVTWPSSQGICPD